jgi:hypothetical protein
VAAAAEEAAAQAALRTEMLASRLAVEERVAAVEADRKLRQLAERQAAVAAAAAEDEARRAVVAADSEAQAVNMQVCVGGGAAVIPLLISSLKLYKSCSEDLPARVPTCADGPPIPVRLCNTSTLCAHLCVSASLCNEAHLFSSCVPRQ